MDRPLIAGIALLVAAVGGAAGTYSWWKFRRVMNQEAHEAIALLKVIVSILQEMRR